MLKIMPSVPQSRHRCSNGNADKFLYLAFAVSSIGHTTSSLTNQSSGCVFSSDAMWGLGVEAQNLTPRERSMEPDRVEKDSMIWLS